MSDVSFLRPAVYTVFALCAFAANSILCRMALGQDAIDPIAFTAIRLISGAVILAPISNASSGRHRREGGSWISAVMLFLYAVGFSFAYISLSAGTGALILFGAVQITMILTGLVQGERPGWVQWAGLAAAMGGFVYLVAPGLQAPSTMGAALMTAAGIAWGVYSLRGRAAKNPISVTGGNFLRAVPPALIIGLIFFPTISVSARGGLLAVASGAVTSGLGYVIWYAALRYLSATRAALVQLIVPVLAAGAGVVFLSETITLRLALSSFLIISGVAAAIMVRSRS